MCTSPFLNHKTSHTHTSSSGRFLGKYENEELMFLRRRAMRGAFIPQVKTRVCAEAERGYYV
jgi:hypothetical protein